MASVSRDSNGAKRACFTDGAVKPATLAAHKQTTDSLLEVLGRRTPVTEITPADADRPSDRRRGRWCTHLGSPTA
jgi:hypothetical protein